MKFLQFLVRDIPDKVILSSEFLQNNILFLGRLHMLFVLRLLSHFSMQFLSRPNSR